MVIFDGILLLICAYMMIKGWAQYQALSNTERMQKLKQKMQENKFQMINIDAESGESMEDLMSRMAKQMKAMTEDVAAKQNTKDMMLLNAHRSRAIAFTTLFTTFALSTAFQWIQLNGVVQIGVSVVGFVLTAMSLMKARNLLQMSQKL